MTMIEKMTMYLFKMMKETIRPDTHSLFLCLLWASFFYCRIFWRRKLETIFLLIISFVVISIRIFDRHALIHAYISIKESFYFPEKNVYIYKHLRKYFHAKNLSLGHPRKNVHAKSQKFSPAKTCQKKCSPAKKFISIRFLFINI